MKLAMFQTEPQAEGVSAALRNLDDAARQAGGHAADLLITPEMYLTGYAIGSEAVRLAALSLDGPTMQEVSEIARNRNIGILVGFPERDGDAIYNSVHLIDRKGASRAVYRKTHMFGEVDRSQFSRGEALSEVVEFAGWKVALAICYDIEFPELAREAALTGAEVMLVPTAAMLPYVSVATQMVPSRAEENEMYVAYANYVGAEPNIRYFGHSTVAGPDGAVIAQADDNADLMFATLDRPFFNAWRAKNDHRRDRRPDLYGATAARNG